MLIYICPKCKKKNEVEANSAGTNPTHHDCDCGNAFSTATPKLGGFNLNPWTKGTKMEISTTTMEEGAKRMKGNG